MRRAGAFTAAGASVVTVGDLSAQTDWSAALAGVEAVVHAAARVHVMQEAAADPLVEFRRINVQGTLQLARRAAAEGVRRFVFISSVKVNGEATRPGHPFTADDAPAPLDAYGISKMEAEQGLREIAAQTGMEVVIIRPPLVYGPGVKANFQSMMRWLTRGVPLPLGAIHNHRSLVALDNLVDLIVTCVDHPAAANQTFLISDGEDLSTTQLLQLMGQALGKPARLIPVPTGLLTLGATLIGKPAIAQRLCGSLQVDISKTRQLLGWSAPVSVDEGLRKAAEGYWREASV
jgi:nucleoside-diphosphate-sugar epimerase